MGSDEMEVVVPRVMSLCRLTAPGAVETCCDASLLVVDSDKNGEAVSAEGVWCRMESNRAGSIIASASWNAAAAAVIIASASWSAAAE